MSHLWEYPTIHFTTTFFICVNSTLQKIDGGQLQEGSKSNINIIDISTVLSPVIYAFLAYLQFLICIFFPLAGLKKKKKRKTEGNGWWYYILYTETQQDIFDIISFISWLIKYFWYDSSFFGEFIGNELNMLSISTIIFSHIGCSCCLLLLRSSCALIIMKGAHSS